MPVQSMPVGPDHPLMKFEPELPNNWHDWAAEWKAAGNSHALRYGLLRSGFTSSPACNHMNHSGDRIEFYLDLADGWYNGFESATDDPITSNRKQLSWLALSELSQHLFRNTAPADRVPSWADQLDLHGVLEKLLWFFRAEGRPLWVTNLGPGNSALPNQALPRFLKEFVEWVWKSKPSRRPQLINILAGTNRLNILLDTHFWLDAACLKTLQQLAYAELPGTRGVPLGRAYLEAKGTATKDAAHVLIMRGIERDQAARAHAYTGPRPPRFHP